MLKSKKIFSVILAVMLVALSFAGCSSSSSKEADTITDETLLIAYTENNPPFFEISEDGKTAQGFEAEIIENIFDNIKDSCKNYKFVKVDEDYRLGEDAAYTDKDGKTYIAYMAVGGFQKNADENNEEYSFTNTVISNRIITLTAKGSKITDYSKMSGAKAAVVGNIAKAALEKNTAIASACKSATDYTDVNLALSDLYSGKVDAVVVDEFNYRTLKSINVSGKEVALDTFVVELNGELDTIEYAFATAKYDRLKDDINEALYELQSPKYNDADQLTPIVEKYFGYNACTFDYQTVQQ